MVFSGLQLARAAEGQRSSLKLVSWLQAEVRTQLSSSHHQPLVSQNFAGRGRGHASKERVCLMRVGDAGAHRGWAPKPELQGDAGGWHTYGHVTDVCKAELGAARDVIMARMGGGWP